MKKTLGVYGQERGHWVGDGFPVRSLFTYGDHGRELDPFLMLDYAGPAEFGPAERPRGVGEHPHRGFETVTIVYQGEVAHRDSTGQGGVIGPGDVQWMTAARGILHEEFHSEAFTRTGGVLEMAQLWVNLPGRVKMADPGYQAIERDSIPEVEVEGGRVRVIAGEFGGARGPARTATAMDVWDVRLGAGAVVELPAAEGRSVGVVVLRGAANVNGAEVGEARVAVMSRTAAGVRLEAREHAVVLWLSGEPIGEPVAGYGPFVMNTREEIAEALEDFRSGRFGRME